MDIVIISFQILQMSSIIFASYLIAMFFSKWFLKIFTSKDSKKILDSFGLDESFIKSTNSFVKYGIILFGIILALANFGIGIVFMEIIFLVIFIAFIFSIIISMRELIPNVMSGLYLVSKKNLKKGDIIEIPELRLKGKIENMNLVHTSLSFKDRRALIPNYLLIKKTVIKIR